MSFQNETSSTLILRDSGRKFAKELQELKTSNPEEYDRIIAQGRAAAEKYRRMARGGK